MPFFEDEGAISIDLSEMEYDLLKCIPIVEDNDYDYINSLIMVVIKSYINNLRSYLQQQVMKKEITKESYKKKMKILKKCENYKDTKMMIEIRKALGL